MSKTPVCGIRSRLRVAVALAGAFLCIAASAQAHPPASAAPASGEPSSVGPAAAPGGIARRVQIPGGRKLYLDCRGRGGPTVILVSGLGNAGDVWSHVDPGVSGPAVFQGVARLSRVCTYDRPNTLLLTDQPGRSDPVRQPQSAGRAVADLHALLRAGDIPGPYVLVGHSYGGLIVRLYASTHPGQVAGLVLVDAANEFQRELFTAAPQQWAALARFQLTPAPGFDPPLELVDFDVSFDQMLRAKAARPLRPSMPVVVLTRGRPEPFPVFPPPFPDQDTVERVWRAAQDLLAGIVPYARHMIARRSGHYIQTAEPRLVIDAVRRELAMVRPATVRCRGGPGLCRARVSLAGGASNRKVVIRLPGTDLRLSSVRPSRTSLDDNYGLFANRLRAGGLEYVFRLNAAQSIPRGSHLRFTFRAIPGR